DDAEANAEVGRYYALLKGNWKKGLPLLLKGKDEALQALAKKDLANPKASKAQVAVGDAWWDLADKEQDPAKLNLQRRAAHWYETALPDLAGLNKVRVEKRLQEVAARAPGAPKEVTLNVPVGEIRKFTGHNGNVFGVAISKDGKRIVSGGSDQMVRGWDATTGKEIRQLQGQAGIVRGVAISPDGKRAASAGSDGTMRVWDVEKGAEARKIQLQGKLAYGLAFSPDGKYLASSGTVGAIQLWNPDTGQEV